MSKKDRLKNISDLVTNCTDCELYKNRINPVFGNGSPDSNLFFIGEAPGRNEDIQGKPFVGRAGEILDDLLCLIGLNRKDIYIANILKCRPPKNRNPLKSEIENCTKYLNKQIEIIKPKIIATFGNFATKYIFEIFGLNYNKISNIHGKSMKIKTNYGNITIIPLFHPASATYDPNKKIILLEDFKVIKKILRK
jgi:DNA polymerase